MEPYQTTRLYGVIGFPVRHSLSPLLHTTGFQAIGYPGVLVPWEIQPESLAEFFSAFRMLGIHGTCVTLPHKEKIMALADEVSQRAKAVGAANTLTRHGDRIVAENTDVAGFMAPLTAYSWSGKRALMLGAGGAARAGVVALRELGFAEVAVTSRSGTSAERLAEEFSLTAVPWASRQDYPADLLVNSTPLGMKGDKVGETPYPVAAFAGRQGVAYDMIYTPLQTCFLQDAAATGWRTITGLDMFIGQADQQFRLWTGQPLPGQARQAVEMALYGKMDR